MNIPPVMVSYRSSKMRIFRSFNNLTTTFFHFDSVNCARYPS